MQRDNGACADASWSKTDGNLITDTYLSATESRDGTDIYLGTYTWDVTNGTTVNDEYGYLFTKDDVFCIDKKLNSATLSEVQINVYNWYTGEMKTLNVTADWTGTGDVQKGSSTYVSTNGDYRFRSTSSSSYRDATVTASVNNEDAGKNGYAGMSIFKSAYIDMEK